MLHDSKTCPLKESDISRIARSDKQLVWWMCHVLEIENHLKICQRGQCHGCFFCQAKLRWCGYVEKMNKENPVNNCRFIEVGGGGGQRGKGRQCKTYTQLVNDVLAKLRLLSKLAQNQLNRRKSIRKTPFNPC